MAKRRLQSRHRRGPRNMGPDMTVRPVPITTPRCCTHPTGMKWVQAKDCLWRATNWPCTSGWPSSSFHNQGPTRGSTAPRLTTNVRKTIEEAQEATLTLCQAINPSSTKKHLSSHPESSGEETRGLPYRRAPTPPTRPQRSPRPPPPTPPHWRPSGAAKEIQIAHNQQMVKTHHPVRPLT